MKKAILLFCAIIAFALSALAEETTGVFMEIHKNGDEEDATKVNRSLVQIPTLDVVYDESTKTIRISSVESSEVNVYIYNESGAIAGYSNSLNTTIQLPASGAYTIYIEGAGWYGIGYIN